MRATFDFKFATLDQEKELKSVKDVLTLSHRETGQEWIVDDYTEWEGEKNERMLGLRECALIALFGQQEADIFPKQKASLAEAITVLNHAVRKIEASLGDSLSPHYIVTLQPYSSFAIGTKKTGSSDSNLVFEKIEMEEDMMRRFFLQYVSEKLSLAPVVIALAIGAYGNAEAIEKYILSSPSAQQKDDKSVPKENIINVTWDDVNFKTNPIDPLKGWDRIDKKALAKKTVEAFRMSGHLADQRLRVSSPRGLKNVPLFDQLRESTQQKIIQNNVERSTLVEGIHLTASERRIIDCLCKLLHKHSPQTTDPGSPDYYAGNGGFKVVPFGEGRLPAQKLVFSLYELAKEFRDGEVIGGKDVFNVTSILEGLAAKRFLISYKETIWKQDKSRRAQDKSREETHWEDFQPLISLISVRKIEYNAANVETSRAEDAVIMLHPIFTHQIGTKWISIPTDLNRRTMIAYGSHKMPEAVLILRDYLLREHSSGRLTPKIGLDKLALLLCEKWVREGRKKKVRETIDRAIETVRALGLVAKAEIAPGKTGSELVSFEIDPEWARKGGPVKVVLS